MVISFWNLTSIVTLFSFSVILVYSYCIAFPWIIVVLCNPKKVHGRLKSTLRLQNKTQIISPPPLFFTICVKLYVFSPDNFKLYGQSL